MELYENEVQKRRMILNLAEQQKSFATRINGIVKRSLLTKL